MNCLVKCADCAWFLRDKIGDGNGLGSCHKFEDYKLMKPSQRAIDKAFKQLGGKPFWPLVDRYCEKFEAGD